jgi:hypothetical protein
MMNDLPVEKRNLQADVYLALATVIQAITLTGLGTEVVSILKDPQKPLTIWVMLTGLLSLQFCISFWYLFVRDYFFGYRLINLTAQNHMVAASFIFILGFLQFIAFQFLADPRLWLTLVLAGVWLVLLHAWYSTGNIQIVEAEGAREAIVMDQGSNLFILLVLAASACLILWYVVPGIDVALFRVIALGLTGAALVLLDLFAIEAFQKHLDVGL